MAVYGIVNNISSFSLHSSDVGMSDVHNKGRVKVVICRHTVLILFAQNNGIDDPFKNFCVASKVTSGIQFAFALSLRVPFNASSTTLFFDRYNFVDFFMAKKYSKYCNNFET